MCQLFYRLNKGGPVVIKAVFINYVLSVILPKGEDYQLVSGEMLRHSKLTTTDEVRNWLIHNIDVYRQNESYTKYENTVLNIVKYRSDDIKFKGNPQKIMMGYQSFWMYAPISDDFKDFIRMCPVPVYIVCNESAEYVRVNLKRNNLHVAEVISTDLVGKSLLNPECYEKALEVACVDKSEVLNVSSSYEELKVAEELGLNSILLDRMRLYRDVDHKRTRSLMETLPQIYKEVGDNS